MADAIYIGGKCTVAQKAAIERMAALSKTSVAQWVRAAILRANGNTQTHLDMQAELRELPDPGPFDDELRARGDTEVKEALRALCAATGKSEAAVIRGLIQLQGEQSNDDKSEDTRSGNTVSDEPAAGQPEVAELV